MWSRQEPWQDIKMPYAVRVANCLQRNQRPPMPPDTPAPLRDLIELCWAANFKDRPTPQEILKIHLPQIDEWSKTQNDIRAQFRGLHLLHQRKKAESFIVAPSVPTKGPKSEPQNIQSSEFLSWESFLFASTSAPELTPKKLSEEVMQSNSSSTPPSAKALDS